MAEVVNVLKSLFAKLEELGLPATLRAAEPLPAMLKSMEDTGAAAQSPACLPHRPLRRPPRRAGRAGGTAFRSELGIAAQGAAGREAALSRER